MPEPQDDRDPEPTPDDQLLRDEVQQRLEQRPRLTLGVRIALVFGVCTLFIGSITVGSTLMLSHVRSRTQFLEAMDECAYQLQEARRYEKNFFLYGTTPYDALDHIHRADRLLRANERAVERATGAAEARQWRASLERYEGLLQDLAGQVAAADRPQGDDDVRREAETALRRSGTEILAIASELLVKDPGRSDSARQAGRPRAAGALLD